MSGSSIITGNRSFPGSNSWAGKTHNGSPQVQSERIVSSNIVGQTMLGPMPQEEDVKYVEVPVIEEVTRHIPKREIVEIEKRVPKYEYEWVERVVEVPQIHFVDKTVEVPQIQEIICHVPVKQIVEIPKEIIRRVPKIETKIVEKEVEVPGEIIEVPKPYLVENKIVIPRYTDKEVPTVVAQQLLPIITESETEFIDVDLKEYNPYLIPVDVYVPRPVPRQLIAASKSDTHRVIDVPIGQFNSLVRQLNMHCTEVDLQGLLVKDPRSGAVPVMPITAGAFQVTPVNSEWEEGYVAGSMRFSNDAPSGPATSATTTGATTSSIVPGSFLATSSHLAQTSQPLMMQLQTRSPSTYATTGFSRLPQSSTYLTGNNSFVTNSASKYNYTSSSSYPIGSTMATSSYQSGTLPASTFPMTSYPMTSYPTTSYPTTSYPTTSYPTTSYPTTSYPAASYQTSSYQTSSYPGSSTYQTNTYTSNYPTSSSSTKLLQEGYGVLDASIESRA